MSECYESYDPLSSEGCSMDYRLLLWTAAKIDLSSFVSCRLRMSDLQMCVYFSIARAAQRGQRQQTAVAELSSRHDNKWRRMPTERENILQYNIRW